MRSLVIAFLAAALLYLLASALVFQPPETPSAGEACGFIASDFQANGSLGMDRWSAWWLAFRRKQDYFSALSIGAAVAFVLHAWRIGRRRGNALRGAGAAAGGGLLALSALCVSCLAPVMSAVGFGLAASWLADVPRWLIAFNTLLFTVWGGLLLSRRSHACPPCEHAGADAPQQTCP